MPISLLRDQPRPKLQLLQKSDGSADSAAGLEARARAYCAKEVPTSKHISEADASWVRNVT